MTSDHSATIRTHSAFGGWSRRARHVAIASSLHVASDLPIPRHFALAAALAAALLDALSASREVSRLFCLAASLAASLAARLAAWRRSFLSSSALSDPAAVHPLLAFCDATSALSRLWAERCVDTASSPLAISLASSLAPARCRLPSLPVRERVLLKVRAAATARQWAARFSSSDMCPRLLPDVRFAGRRPRARRGADLESSLSTRADACSRATSPPPPASATAHASRAATARHFACAERQRGM